MKSESNSLGELIEESVIQTPQEVVTCDGIEFLICTNDVIELTEEQFNKLALTVLKRKAEYIRKDGVDIATLNSEQINNIINEIHNIIGDSNDPLKDNLIRISSHIADEHACNTEELEKRGWYRNTIQELYDDIVNVIKKANDVRKAKLKFRTNENKSYQKFTFTIIGIKINGDLGEVVIAFMEDNNELILAVTII